MAGSSDSIGIYREMLKLDPSSRIFEVLAEELCAAGQWSEVARVCREGLKYHPDHMRPKVLLGLALMELGESGEAEPLLLEINEEIRKSSIIYKLLSGIADLSGDSEHATRFARIYEAFHGQDLPGVCDGKMEAEETERPSRPKAPTLPPGQIEMFLSALADRIESRFGAAPAMPPIFSDSDRELLKKAILDPIA